MARLKSIMAFIPSSALRFFNACVFGANVPLFRAERKPHRLAHGQVMMAIMEASPAAAGAAI
jgi:hypothetical protein